MLQGLVSCLTITEDDHHLWCPSPFILDDKLYVAVAAWPKEDFEGWRYASSLRLFEITCLAGEMFEAIAVVDWQIEDTNSLINPRVVVADRDIHLFCSRVSATKHYEIAYAKLDSLKAKPDALVALELPALHGVAQGPTNPAPLLAADGTWRMLYRDSTGIGGKRSLYAASALKPAGPWKALGIGPVFEGDLEDPFVWQSGSKYFALVRDIGGTVTGKGWAAIGQMETQNWENWTPSVDSHVCNRSIPQADGTASVMHRLERPAILDFQGRQLIFFACLEKADGIADIRILQAHQSGGDIMKA